MCKGIRYIAAGAAALAFLGGVTPAALGCGNADTPLFPPDDQPLYLPASVSWADEGNEFDPEPILLLNVDLALETQWDIYRLCDYRESTFCFLMAIAARETGFDPQAVGDTGNSKGLMQINVRWHTGRMESLGVTDLTDPVQCAAVAMDNQKELEVQPGFAPESEALLMAYNMGPGNAKKAISKGSGSTDYSRETFSIYQGFMKEMEGLT